MSIRTIIKAGLLTASLVSLAAPALARDEDQGRAERGQRGGGDDGGRGGRGDNGGGRNDNGGRGGDEGRGRPAPAAAPAPPPTAPVVRASPPVAAAPAADNGRFQRGNGNRAGNVEQPRPGTPQWYGQRGITPPAPAADRNDRNDAANNPGRSNGGWQNGGGRDRDNNARDNNNGRDGNWRGNDGRNNDGRNGNWQGNRGNDNRDRNANDNRSGNNNWRYTPGRRVENRWNGVQRWNNNDWRRDQRYNWQYWRNTHRDVFRLPRYYAPYGWSGGYSRFSIGIYLNSILFGDTYWIDDPWSYRLPPAYGPLRWVRYYNDALLVDIRDGYVVDVVYDVFW